MKKLTFIGLVLISISSFAQSPVESFRKTCATGSATGGIRVMTIPTTEIVEDDHFQPNFHATYSVFRGNKIGYAKDINGAYSIIFGKLVSSIETPSLNNISQLQYTSMLRRGDIVFGPTTDWSLLRSQKNKYLCIALGQPMAKADILIYLLDLSREPHKLFFSIEAAR